MAEKTDEKEARKKCAHTGATIKRAKRYYRNGKFFANKNAFVAFMKKEQEKAAEAAADVQEEVPVDKKEENMRDDDQNQEAPSTEEAPQEDQGTEESAGGDEGGSEQAG